ncbi:MAG: hypothetical protein V4712_05805 [Pseudomonadota bacterium]
MAEAALIATAMQAFRRLARPLDLKLGQFSATVVSASDDPAQAVLRLTDGDRVLILKWHSQPQAVRALVKSAEAQTAATASLHGVPGLHVPQVLAAGLAEKAVLLEPPLGQPLQDGGTDLGRVAHWLDVFHAKTLTTPRAFQPKFMVAHVERMAADAARRPNALPDVPEFQRCASLIVQQADRAEGHSIAVAQSHGDFAARNTHLTPDVVSVDSFRPASAAPVAFDVARLLMDILPLSDMPADDGLPAAVLDGFFARYTHLAPDDPVLMFLLKTRLLAEWRMIPAKPATHNARQARRWQGVQALAGKLLTQ